jgi:CRP-like cAMP-binding protein
VVLPEYLKDYSLFAGLTSEELARVAPHMYRRAVPRGSYLFRPDTPGHNTYIVEEGMIRLFFANLAGEEFILNLVPPGEVFGVPVPREEIVRVYGASAFRDSSVLSIEGRILLEIAAGIPQLMLNLYSDVLKDLRNLTLHTRMLATARIETRLAAMLLHLGTGRGSGEPGNSILLTQSELATWIGASRGRVNRAISQFEGQGWIRVDRKRIHILNLQELKGIAEEKS